MKANRGIIEKIIASILRGKSNLILGVYADEPGSATPNTDPANQPNTQTVNYEDLIAKARKEEKDKLYPRIKELETEVETWTKRCNQHLITIEKREREISELKESLKKISTGENPEVAKMKSEIDRLTQELEAAKSSAPNVEELEKKIKDKYDVLLYREQVLREAGDAIIPELITGTTKEEIDASLTVAKERFQKLQQNILDKAGATHLRTSNPDTSRFTSKEMTLEEFAKLDPRSPEYKEARKKLGFK